jgi:hypothetical protein
MSDEPIRDMTPDEVRAYRESVDALIAACLERIRAHPIDANVEPAPPPRSAP